MSLPDQQSMTGCKAEARQRKNNLITATYPQAEGLQVQAAQREAESQKKKESGIITAQTIYSDSTTLAAPIKITLRAITGCRPSCYCTPAAKPFDNHGGFTVCQHYSPYLNRTDLFWSLKFLG